MLKIDDKALNYVQSKNLCFVICGNCKSNVRVLRIKVLYETGKRQIVPTYY